MSVNYYDLLRYLFKMSFLTHPSVCLSYTCPIQQDPLIRSVQHDINKCLIQVVRYMKMSTQSICQVGLCDDIKSYISISDNHFISIMELCHNTA